MSIEALSMNKQITHWIMFISLERYELGSFICKYSILVKFNARFEAAQSVTVLQFGIVS